MPHRPADVFLRRVVLAQRGALINAEPVVMAAAAAGSSTPSSASAAAGAKRKRVAVGVQFATVVDHVAAYPYPDPDPRRSPQARGADDDDDAATATAAEVDGVETEAARAARIAAFVHAHKLVPPHAPDAAAASSSDATQLATAAPAAAATAGAGAAAGAAATPFPSLVRRYAVDPFSVEYHDLRHDTPDRTRAQRSAELLAMVHWHAEAKRRGLTPDTAMLVGPFALVEARAVRASSPSATAVVDTAAANRGPAQTQAQVWGLTRPHYVSRANERRLRTTLNVLRAEADRVTQLPAQTVLPAAVRHPGAPLLTPEARRAATAAAATARSALLLPPPAPALAHVVHPAVWLPADARSDAMHVTTCGVAYRPPPASAVATAGAKTATTAPADESRVAHAAFVRCAQAAAAALAYQRQLVRATWERLNPRLSFSGYFRRDTPDWLEANKHSWLVPRLLREPSSGLAGTTTTTTTGTTGSHGVQALCWLRDDDHARAVFGRSAFDGAPCLLRDEVDVAYSATFSTREVQGVRSGLYASRDYCGRDEKRPAPGTCDAGELGVVDGTDAAMAQGRASWRAHRATKWREQQALEAACGGRGSGGGGGGRGWLVVVGTWSPRTDAELVQLTPGHDRAPVAAAETTAAAADARDHTTGQDGPSDDDDDDPLITPDAQWFTLLDPVTGATKRVPVRLRYRTCCATLPSLDDAVWKDRGGGEAGSHLGGTCVLVPRGAAGDSGGGGAVSASAASPSSASGPGSGSGGSLPAVELWVSPQFAHGGAGLWSVADGVLTYRTATPLLSRVPDAFLPLPAPVRPGTVPVPAAPARALLITGQHLMLLHTATAPPTTTTATAAAVASPRANGGPIGPAVPPRFELPGAAAETAVLSSSSEASTASLPAECRAQAQALLDANINSRLFPAPGTIAYRDAHGLVACATGAHLDLLDRIVHGGFQRYSTSASERARTAATADALTLRATQHTGWVRDSSFAPQRVLAHPNRTRAPHSVWVTTRAANPGATCVFQLALPVDADALWRDGLGFVAGAGASTRPLTSGADAHDVRHRLPRELWSVVCAYAASPARVYAHPSPAIVPPSRPDTGAGWAVGIPGLQVVLDDAPGSMFHDSVLRVLAVLPNPDPNADRWCAQCQRTRVVALLCVGPASRLCVWYVPDKLAAAMDGDASDDDDDHDDDDVKANSNAAAMAAAAAAKCAMCSGQAVQPLCGTHRVRRDDADERVSARSDDGPLRTHAYLASVALHAQPCVVLSVADLLRRPNRDRDAAKTVGSSGGREALLPWSCIPGATEHTTHVLLIGDGARVRRVPFHWS